MTRTWPARVISGAALLASGGPAFVVSYQHMYELAIRLGSEPLVAGMMPWTTDGVVASASVLIYTAGRQRRTVPRVAWPLLAAGIAVTIVVNAAAGSGHGVGGRLLSAWPALAFCGCLEAAVALARMTSKPRAAVSQPAFEPPRATPEPPEPPEPVCDHQGGTTAEEIAENTYLHERDCLGRDPGEISRRAIARQSGLSRPKVARLVESMNGHGTLSS